MVIEGILQIHVFSNTNVIPQLEITLHYRRAGINNSNLHPRTPMECHQQAFTLELCGARFLTALGSGHITTIHYTGTRMIRA